MCGICGYVNIDRRPITDGKVVGAMTDTLTHRGPDDRGLFIHDNVALGHRRLSIIDLDTGHQPIFSDDGSLAIVYNGEVYNFVELRDELIAKGHRFSTRSDTEVVLKSYAEWGPAAFQRFNGMFSLAIWDGRDKTLRLARDRIGKKPLYYTKTRKEFIFASELKAIYKHPAVKLEISRPALHKYLAHDYIPGPNTIIKDIYKLQAGHYLVLKGEGLDKKMYWDFRFNFDDGMRRDFKSAKSRLVALLQEAVKKRLVSDVPLGVFLSGGIDSSAVVAMMSRLMDPKEIRTFSIGFEEKSYDEADSARIIARRFNTTHFEKVVTARMLLDSIPVIVNTLDEPFADSSIIPTYAVSRFTREHVTVALGGDAGDKLFMGYPSFIAHRIAAVYDMMPSFVKQAVALTSDLAPGKSSYMGLHFKLNRFLRGVKHPHDIRHQVWIGSFPPDEQKLLFRHASDGAEFEAEGIFSESRSYFNRYPDIPNMDKVEYLYIKTYLVDDILTKVDRASMATSLEVRAPFLDKELVEFAGTIPNELKLKGFTTKYILKEALKDILPRETLYKPKHGFAVPLGSWFRSELRAMISEMLSRDRIEREGIFDHGYIGKLLRDHFDGKIDNGRKLWNLFVFEKWLERWMG